MGTSQLEMQKTIRSSQKSKQTFTVKNISYVYLMEIATNY